MTHGLRPCKRCGWLRTTNSRTPALCTSCRGHQERTDPDDEHIEWHQAGLIKRGTVHPPTTSKGA